MDIRESLFLLPIVIIYLTYYARRDLTQRKKRFLLVITHLLKLEVLLGLHENITQKLTSFKEDKYLFAEYQQNLSNIKTGDFIEKEMKKKVHCI